MAYDPKTQTITTDGDKKALERDMHSFLSFVEKDVLSGGTASMSFQDAVGAYRRGELGIRVDYGMAINAAAAGFNSGVIASLLAMAFWVLLIAIIPAWIFGSFLLAVAAFVAAIISRVLCKRATGSAVIKASLQEEMWFNLFRDRGVIKLERI
jgi:hypothetical protein